MEEAKEGLEVCRPIIEASTQRESVSIFQRSSSVRRHYLIPRWCQLHISWMLWRVSHDAMAMDPLHRPNYLLNSEVITRLFEWCNCSALTEVVCSSVTEEVSTTERESCTNVP